MDTKKPETWAAEQDGQARLDLIKDIAERRAA